MQDEAAPLADEFPSEDIYNQVFEFYVQRLPQGVDLAGLIAYSLYKYQKREWLIAYRDRNGRLPSAQEIAAFTGGYINSDARLIYRGQAESLLNAYAATYVEARAPTIREDTLNSEMMRQARAIEESLKAQSAFWPTVWSGIVATALWTFVIAILAASLKPEIFQSLFSAVTQSE